MTDNSSISLSYKASCNKLIKAVQHTVDVREYGRLLMILGTIIYLALIKNANRMS